MSENLNIDVAAMLNQLPPEMQKQMQTFINIMKGGQNAVVPQAGPSGMAAALLWPCSEEGSF